MDISRIEIEVKIEILAKYRNFGQRFVCQNRNLVERSMFFQTRNIWSKIEIFGKKAEIFGENSNYFYYRELN